MILSLGKDHSEFSSLMVFLSQFYDFDKNAINLHDFSFAIKILWILQVFQVAIVSCSYKAIPSPRVISAPPLPLVPHSLPSPLDPGSSLPLSPLCTFLHVYHSPLLPPALYFLVPHCPLPAAPRRILLIFFVFLVRKKLIGTMIWTPVLRLNFLQGARSPISEPPNHGEEGLRGLGSGQEW